MWKRIRRAGNERKIVVHLKNFMYKQYTNLHKTVWKWKEVIVFTKKYRTIQNKILPRTMVNLPLISIWLFLFISSISGANTSTLLNTCIRSKMAPAVFEALAKFLPVRLRKEEYVPFSQSFWKKKQYYILQQSHMKYRTWSKYMRKNFTCVCVREREKILFIFC